MNKQLITSSLLALGACTSSPPELSLEHQQLYMTLAVDMVAYEGGKPVSIDKRVPCDFDLLVGDLAARELLTDDPGYKTAVVQDVRSGNVPEFGLIQCYEDDNGDRIIRGNTAVAKHNP